MNKAIIANIIFGLLGMSMACFGTDIREWKYSDRKSLPIEIPDVWTVNESKERISLKEPLQVGLDDQAHTFECVLYIPNKSSISAIARLHSLYNLKRSLSAEFFSQNEQTLKSAKSLLYKKEPVYAAFPTENMPQITSIYNVQEIIDERKPIDDDFSLHTQKLKTALIEQSTSIENFTSILEVFLEGEIRSFTHLDIDGPATPLSSSKIELFKNNPHFMKIISEATPHIITSLKEKKANTPETLEILEKKLGFLFSDKKTYEDFMDKPKHSWLRTFGFISVPVIFLASLCYYLMHHPDTAHYFVLQAK